MSHVLPSHGPRRPRQCGRRLGLRVADSLLPSVQRALLGSLAAVALMAAAPLRADCFEAAGRQYHVSPALLRAVAQQESSMNPRAINRNRNGSFDIGMMQINSSWLPLLARHGIREQDLWEPCTNVMVGAWILGSNFKRMGVTVAALGAYNTSHPQGRQRYAEKVLARLRPPRQPGG